MKIESEIQPGMLVANAKIKDWPLLVLKVGRWVKCLDPDGCRSMHELGQLKILETGSLGQNGGQHVETR